MVVCAFTFPYWQESVVEGGFAASNLYLVDHGGSWYEQHVLSFHDLLAQCFQALYIIFKFITEKSTEHIPKPQGTPDCRMGWWNVWGLRIAYAGHPRLPASALEVPGSGSGPGSKMVTRNNIRTGKKYWEIWLKFMISGPKSLFSQQTSFWSFTIFFENQMKGDSISLFHPLEWHLEDRTQYSWSRKNLILWFHDMGETLYSSLDPRICGWCCHWQLQRHNWQHTFYIHWTKSRNLISSSNSNTLWMICFDVYIFFLNKL